MTDNTVAYVACYAKNRPSSSRTVHAVLDGDDRALCGVWRGDPPSGEGRVTCWTCREALGETQRQQPAAPPEEAAVIAAAEEVFTGPPLVHIEICGRHCHVYMTWNTLVLAIVRQMPGAKWHREQRMWSMPSALADELARRLTLAGAQVSSEILP
jgi:hypothetical protein